MKLPARVVHVMSLFWDALFAFVMAIITWRVYLGTINKRDYAETTFMLEFPIWWGFASVTAAAAVATLIAIWMVWVRVSDLMKGTPI